MAPVHQAINYVEITVTDMGAAQHFYTTAFGWRFTDCAPAYAGIQAPEGDGEVGGLSLGQHVEPGGRACLGPLKGARMPTHQRMLASGRTRDRSTENIYDLDHSGRGQLWREDWAVEVRKVVVQKEGGTHRSQQGYGVAM